MPDRLSPLDASFLYLEDRDTPMHVGNVAVFAVPADGYDHDRMRALIDERIALVPRCRQRVRMVPGRLANPVWIDDGEFDLSYHVRRAALPRPGTMDQLCELVARVMSRPLDRERPLWEMYLVEGLEHDRFAVLSKTHQAAIDGAAAADIGQVILDPEPEAEMPDGAREGSGPWRPEPEPGWAELVAGAVAEAVRRPRVLGERLRAGFADVGQGAEHLLGGLGGLAAALRTAVASAPASPLNASIGSQRRFAIAETSLADHRAVRAAHDGTVNDVVLATVTGALRTWLLTRGEPVRTSTSVRALVPVTVQGERGGRRVISHLVDLPVGEPSPVVRLQRISYAMRAHHDSANAVSAQTLVGLAGFAPPTLHAAGARVASGLSRRLFNLVITNVPGPQTPLYAAGARMLASYPVVPLARGQAVSVGATSYDGAVRYGLNADRVAMADVDVLASCLRDAMDELLQH